MNNQFYYGFFDELEKQAFTPAAQKLLGASAGAGVGALSTQRKPGESNSDYAKRTALMAGAGGALGFGGVMGARKLMGKLKADKLVKQRGEAGKFMAGAAGLSALGAGISGKGGKYTNAFRSAQNILGDDLAQGAVSGKASMGDIVEGLGAAAGRNEKNIGAIFSNIGKRKEYNKALREFKSTGAKTDAEISAFEKQLKKRMGMSGKNPGTFLGDLGALFSGGKVKMPKTEEQMAYDKIKKDAFSTGMKGLKTEKVRNVLGRQDSVKFTQGGARQAENQLNKAINRINLSDTLDDAQKSQMIGSLIKKFEKQFNVKVDDKGSMAGRSLRDRLRATGASMFGMNNKYTIRAKGDNPYGVMRGLFTGEKVAHIANDILKKHRY